MPEPTLGEIREAMADQIMNALSGTADPLIEQLQVVPKLELNPTPPAIDIYVAPENPVTIGLGFGSGNVEFGIIVRARVTTADSEGGQELLDNMMDPRAATSVVAALEADPTLGGVIEELHAVASTGLGLFPASGTDGNLLGCTWTFRVFP